MIFEEAKNILSGVLHPYSYDQFFENIVGRKPLALLGEGSIDNSMMLGSDPKSVILGAYEKYAPTLSSHIRTPTVAPPSARPVADAGAFQALINEYHQRGYTVRIPDVTDLSDTLSQFTRALEVIVENPVGVVIFWSTDEALAPVHHDEIDVIAIQLVGTKTWFISDEMAKLPNKWKSLGEGQPSMGKYSTYDVQPGDVLYLPRGTPHTVQSTSESIHLSIGFVPVTIREAISAVLDYLSEFDRSLRADVGTRADDLAKKQGAEAIFEQVRLGLEKIKSSCQSDLFIQDSLARRRARMISDLPRLSPADMQKAITINSKIRHNPLAIAELTATPDIVDFMQPGEQILIHLGAEECLRFIMNTPEFRVSDIPGEVGDDIRIAIVGRMLASGYLELVQ